MGKKNTYMLALAITIIFSIVIGFLPQTKSGLWFLMGLQILISAAAGITFPLLWSMFADIADWSENRTGVVSTGLIFSSSSMAQKFGAAFGSALILWVLAAYGYDTSEGAVQSAASINGLKAMMSWIPAVGAAIALIAMRFYPLTEKKMAEVSASLAVKRGDGQSA
jgi:GPH family glycoside/pentoside/hexuronide:cation symporter